MTDGRTTGPDPGDDDLGDLVAAVRRLIGVVVGAAVPGPATARAAAAVRALTDDLAAASPDGRPAHLLADGPTLVDAMPFDLVVGPLNPLAVPFELTWEPPVAIGTGTFQVAYQGAPGWVHGGAIAASFDIILTAANVLSGTAGPTVDLQVRYHRPTLLGVPVRFEAEVERRTEQRVVSRGRLVQDGRVTASATGTFAAHTRTVPRPGGAGDAVGAGD